MDKEITIYRNKFKIFGIFFFMLLISVLVGFFALYDVRKIGMLAEEPGKFIATKVVSIVILPFLLLTAIYYFTELFNKAPVLVINERGFLGNTGRYCVGLVPWSDIKNITVISDNMVYISVHLKNPGKYFEDERHLKRIKRRWPGKAFGQINVHSVYFKKEVPQVLDLLMYYVDKYHIGEDSGL